MFLPRKHKIWIRYNSSQLIATPTIVFAVFRATFLIPWVCFVGTFETNGLVWNKLAASKLLLWKRKEMARCLEKEMPRKMKIYRPSMEVMHQLKYILSKRGKKSLQTLAKSASLKSSLEWSILCNLCFTLQRKSIYCTKKYCHFYKLVDFCAKSLMMEPDAAVEWNKDKKTKQFNKFSLHIFISVHELVIPRW